MVLLKPKLIADFSKYPDHLTDYIVNIGLFSHRATQSFSRDNNGNLNYSLNYNLTKEFPSLDRYCGLWMELKYGYKIGPGWWPRVKHNYGTIAIELKSNQRKIKKVELKSEIFEILTGGYHKKVGERKKLITIHSDNKWRFYTIKRAEWRYREKLVLVFGKRFTTPKNGALLIRRIYLLSKPKDIKLIESI